MPNQTPGRLLSSLLTLLIVLCLAPLARAQLTVTPTNATILDWIPNTEEDLAGYRVYRSLTLCNVTNNGASLVPIITLALGSDKLLKTWTDATIPNDAKQVCYAITAFDVAGNESKFSNLVDKTFALPILGPPTNIKFDAATRVFTWTPVPGVGSTKLYVHKPGAGNACPADFLFCGVVTGGTQTVPAIAWDSANECWMTSVNADGVEGAKQDVPCTVGARPPAQLMGHWSAKTDVPADPKQNLKAYTVHALVNPQSALTSFAPIFIKNYTIMLYGSSKGYCATGAIVAANGAGSTNQRLCLPAPLVAGRWTALTLVYDGVMLSLYRDKVLAGSVATPPPVDSTDTMQICGSKFNEVCGSDVEVWLYDGPLTTEQVAALPSSPTIPIAMRATPSTLAFTAAQNDPDPAVQSVTLSNVGVGALSWTTKVSQPWLVVTPSTGTQAGTVKVQAKRGTLAVGSYVASITFTPPTGTPVSVAVTFAITKDITAPRAPAGLTLK